MQRLRPVTKASPPARITRWAAFWTPRRFATVSAILLSIAALTTSWSSYQASIWSGKQSAYYTEASRLRVSSSRAAASAGQLLLLDISLFSQWLAATVEHRPQTAGEIQRRFRPEFTRAFDFWLRLHPLENHSAPSSPFVMAIYRIELGDSASFYERESGRVFALGQRANSVSDGYVLNTVVLAAVLFFAGTAQQFSERHARLGVLGLALAMSVFAVVNLFRYPIAR